ncbi:MAG: multidrug efflux pump subunit AcrA (membrane-fusion protein) [Myxococcota bacterium]|jgi:multidrug efflux pump subunit AcrA (membrane-fusion protein)
MANRQLENEKPKSATSREQTSAAHSTGSSNLRLFARPEYLERFKTLDSIQIPSASRTLAGVIVLALFFFGALFAFVPWVQTSVGTGRVTTLNPSERTQEIAVLVGGRIMKWHVYDGMQVKEGDPIVEIVDVDPRLVERLQAERAAIASQYESARVATETGKINSERQRRLADEGLASDRQFESATIKYKELKAKQSATLAKLNQVDVKLARQTTQLVTAPRDGTIVRLHAGGRATLVQAGQTVATLTPSGVDLAAEIFVGGLDAPLITPGRRLRVEFEGWPAVQFSGWPSVAVGTFGGVVANIDPSVSANGLFRILVTEDPEDPWPDQTYLRLGSQVKGWVLLNTVPLGYEVWRQLNRFPPVPDLLAPAAGK